MQGRFPDPVAAVEQQLPGGLILVDGLLVWGDRGEILLSAARLKGIGSGKLYRVGGRSRDRWPHLGPALFTDADRRALFRLRTWTGDSA